MEKMNEQKVVPFRSKTHESELERLNRLTGLNFDPMPYSLIKEEGGLLIALDEGEELINRALYLWSDNA